MRRVFLPLIPLLVWASSVIPASATPAGTPQSLNACMGYITAYGDHPELSPAWFAKYIDGISVRDLMELTRDFCGTGNR